MSKQLTLRSFLPKKSSDTRSRYEDDVPDPKRLQLSVTEFESDSEPEELAVYDAEKSVALSSTTESNHLMSPSEYTNDTLFDTESQNYDLPGHDRATCKFDKLNSA